MKKMTSMNYQKRINKEMRDNEKDSESTNYLLIRYNPNNILEWYFVVYNIGESEEAFKGGYYLGKVTISKEYPFKAPTFMMITENGRFKPKTTLCTTFSHYHPEEWCPEWTIKGCLIGLISFMTDFSNEASIHVGGMATSIEEKKRLAAISLAENKKNPTFVKFFPELC